MTEAQIIPFKEGAGRRRRSAADAAASAVAAGAARASGERVRRQRRTTPLLSGAAPEGAPDSPAAAVAQGRPEQGRAAAAPVTGPTAAGAPPASGRRPAESGTAGRRVSSAKPAAGSTGRRSTPGSTTAADGPPQPPGAGPARAARADPPRKARASTRPKPVPATEPSAAAGPTQAAEDPSDAAAAHPATENRASVTAPGGQPRVTRRRVVHEPAAGGGHPPLRPVPQPPEVLQPEEPIPTPEPGAAEGFGWDSSPLGDTVADRLSEAVALLRRRLTGDVEVDDYGFDTELTDQLLLPLLRPLYKHWFRVEVRGIHNIPDEGGCLVVANHSGTLAFDALMTQLAVHDEHPHSRHLRMLAADLVFNTPFVGELARKSGATLASNADAERMLAGGEVVGVWPEGFKGIGKPFSERYKLQRFGRGGFVSAALRTGTPIVPCAIVGAEEIYPMIGNIPSLARLLGLPYAPVTPTWPWLGLLGMVPLPSKWLIEFGTPITTDEHEPAAAEDPMLVFDLTDRVRQTIQQTLYALLVQRRSVFF